MSARSFASHVESQPAFARFLRHSVHAFGVTTPMRRLFELTDPSIAVVHEGVYC